MNLTHSRRQFLLAATAKLPFLCLLGTSARFVNAAPKATLDLVWGGLGFSSKSSEVNALFPNVTQSLTFIGNTPVMVKRLIQGLEANYQGGQGKVRDISESYSSDDGLLIICVAFDYEQLLATQSATDKTMNDVESFVFCQTQVLYLQTNAAGSQDGARLNVLYSYPFRVQYNFRAKAAKPEDTLEEFSKNLIVNNNSLLNVFNNKVAKKSFKELKFPKGIRVTSVAFNEAFNKSLDFVGIRDQFKDDLIGNALSSSMADKGGLSVIPFRSNQMLGASLAARFKDDTKVLELASKMGGKDMLDYEIGIEMFKLVRKVSGENIANVRIARGMSAFVTVSSTISGKEVFKQKITQTSDLVIDRISMESNLYAFDLRYLIQMVFKMFDDFIMAVMTQDPKAMASVGLNAQRDKDSLDGLKKVFLSCKYDS